MAFPFPPFGASILEPDLNARLGQIRAQGQTLACHHIRVLYSVFVSIKMIMTMVAYLSSFESALKGLQLLGAKRSATAALFAIAAH